ncbi:MAG: hypothetical protein JNJ54_23095 [Myxococcaceae bacterium]|nr:hypothetical protein [Myxococcaceae bacterium]
MRLVTGAASGGSGPLASIVNGVDGSLVFVSRATAHAASFPHPEHVALLREALASAWRREGGTPQRLAALLDFLHTTLVRDHGETRRSRTLELCAAALDGDRLWATNVSAHRVSLVREGAVQQLTRDWTLGEERKRQGLPPLDAGLGSLVTRVLGRESQASGEIVIEAHPVRPGDVVLLTSGWFHHEVDEAQVERLLRRAAELPEADTAARFLVAERAAAAPMGSFPELAVFSTGVLVAHLRS